MSRSRWGLVVSGHSAVADLVKQGRCFRLNDMFHENEH